MKISIATMASALALSFLVSEAPAQPNTDYGKAEFESNCASCHGLSGKGDGPLSQIYVTKPTDLTTLAKRNDGVFPAKRVYEIIDGRQEVKVHGPRSMPVWGQDYRNQAPDLLELGVYDLRGGIANAKILGLVDYLYRIQEK